jgi:diguanylate cyclase
MLNMQPAALRDALEQLDQATQDHLEWHANLLRTIICELPCRHGDLALNAHRLCRFGKWYYEIAAPELGDWPTFAGIGLQHEQVHRIAAELLREIAAGRGVNDAAFDEFITLSLRLRHQLEQLKRELQGALGSRDALTGAYDRERVLPELRRWREPVLRGTLSCTIVLLDFDRLQEVNRGQGHLIGDALLVHAVQLLRQHLRADDKLFRYGGDEFLLSLPGADLDTARAVVGRIRDGLAQHELFVAGASSILRVTASFGLALLDPTVRVEDAIDRAAQALMLAKTAGGNRAISWDPAVTTDRHLRRLDIEAIRDAAGGAVTSRRESEEPNDGE